ncbi:MAG: Cytochrome b6-f complex iron-sulfur subunit PetC1 [Chloroflexota bacterium]|nr:Cytochrome b6-f complex iron-sulfur subunit PetC1 [Chloroflexota bacterium]
MAGTARDDGLQPISGPVLRAARETQTAGLSRRQLMRRAVGAGVGLWFLEVTAGTLGFLWSAAAQATAKVRIGTFDELLLANGDLPVADGFPAYVAAARAFVTIVDPDRRGWDSGRDETGEGTALNVRALSQRCPHLGCRPNPCLEDFWFQCPCHQSRYDRLGIKAAGELFGPAPRGLDRYAIEVDASGVLFVDTGRITLGPLPVALGQPGLIPPLVPRGCV